MKKSIIISLALLTTSISFAEPRSDDQMSMTREKRVDQLTADLGLTDEQKKQIQSSRDKFRSLINEKEAAFGIAKNKFASAIQNPNSSSVDLETLYKQQEDAHRALQDIIFQSRMEFRNILTTEQRTKMISKRGEAREKVKPAKGSKEKKQDHIPPSATISPLPPPTPVK